jgi:putative transposase
MDYKVDQYRVHLIAYHLIWLSRCRKPVLVNDVAKDFVTLIRRKCKAKGWTVRKLIVKPYYVHLLVQVSPTTPAVDVVMVCKETTSYKLRKKYPHLLTLPSLWARHYFASTEHDVSQETIRHFCSFELGRCRVAANSNIIRGGNNKYEIDTDDPKAG